MSRFPRVLRHRNFRYLFFGQAASVTGDRLVVVALALYVTERTGSATDLGLVLAAQTVPLVALVLFGGVFADRLPRQKIMVLSDLVRGVLHALLAVLILTGGAQIWQLAVIEALFGAAQAFFQPAYTGLVPQTVPEEEIQDAKALSESVANVAFMAGPALATVIVLGAGAGEAFALDAASFFFSAYMVIRIRPRARGETPQRGSVFHELRAGWDEVRSRTWVWVLIACFTVAIFTGFAMWYSLAPVIARDHYGTAAVFGVLESLAGLGAVGGSVAGLRWRPRRPVFTGMTLALVWPVECIAFAAGAPVVLVAPLSIATGFGFSLLVIWWETALAQNIPPAALSRVSAWDWMGSGALLPLGYVVAGPLANAFGARLTLAVAGLIALSALLLGRAQPSVRALEGGGDRPLGDPQANRRQAIGRSTEQPASEPEITVRREAEVAHVDALV